jgi:hypothetical protein
MIMTSKVLFTMNMLLLKLKRLVFIDLEIPFWCEAQAFLIPFLVI